MTQIPQGEGALLRNLEISSVARVRCGMPGDGFGLLALWTELRGARAEVWDLWADPRAKRLPKVV
jgi:hypothetical protein